MTTADEVEYKFFRRQRARKLHMEAVEGLTKSLGPTHEETLTANVKLAAMDLKLRGDDVLKARGNMNEVMKQRCRKIGKYSGFALWSKVCLTRMDSASGPDEAVDKDMRAPVQIGTENIGEEHFAVVLGRTSLAWNPVQRKLFRRRGNTARRSQNIRIRIRCKGGR